jgi:hypothetical protein
MRLRYPTSAIVREHILMSGTTQARDTLEAPPTSAMDMAKIVQERDQLRMLDKERRKTMMQQVPRMCSLTRY